MILPFWQCYWMWKRGQSIGKKIMGIKVIRLDNRSPDFRTNVIKREFIYYIYIYICIFLQEVVFIYQVCRMSFFIYVSCLCHLICFFSRDSSISTCDSFDRYIQFDVFISFIFEKVFICNFTG